MSLLAILVAGIGQLTAATKEKTILMLVTSADKMTHGKPTGLWLEEFAVPYDTFTEAGYQVKVVSTKGGAAPIDPRSEPSADQAAAWKSAAQRLIETKPVDSVKAEDFRAMFISGGHGAMFDLAKDPAVATLIQKFDEQAKPIAAVCHGPAALVNVVRKDGIPLVNGRTLTTFTNAEERAVKLEKEMPFLLETRLRKLGATVETRDNFVAHAVRDGNLITGQNPASSEATAKLLLEALSEKKE